MSASGHRLWAALLAVWMAGLVASNPPNGSSIDVATVLDAVQATSAMPDLGMWQQVVGSYQHDFTAPQRKRGLAYMGANSRMRSVLEKLQRGEHVHVGIVGGEAVTHCMSHDARPGQCNPSGGTG